MMFCWKGIVQAVVVVLLLQGAEGVPQANSNEVPEINGNSNKNVLTYPVGGVVDSTAPVVITWVASTPGPIMIELLHEGRRISDVSEDPIKNTGSFEWKAPKDLPRGVKYSLKIRDEKTGESTTSESAFSLSPKASVIVITTLSTRTRSTSSTSSRPPTVTDTTLLLDFSSTPTPNPAIPVAPLVAIDRAQLDGSDVAPEPNVIAGATIGACAAAGLLLTGIFLIWRHRRSRGMEDIDTLDEKHERKVMDDRESEVEAYGRTRGMVNAF